MVSGLDLTSMVLLNILIVRVVVGRFVIRKTLSPFIFRTVKSGYSSSSTKEWSGVNEL